VSQNFLFPQRDQPLLLPVDTREWLPEDDLVYVVLDAVAAVDLKGFRRRYRADGHGRAAFDPEMMVALLLYAYSQGERSSRVIEKRCVRDVGYRVVTGGLRPDHATIARFRARHERGAGRAVQPGAAAAGRRGHGGAGRAEPRWDEAGGQCVAEGEQEAAQIEKVLAEAAAVDAAEDARRGEGPPAERHSARRVRFPPAMVNGTG
jgi:transposase